MFLSQCAILLMFISGSVVFSWEDDTPEFYTHTAIDINTMEDVHMSKYKGLVIMVVNLASECGYTDSNYRQLVDLQRSYDPNRFVVLGFPCNQFGKQEPKNNKFIREFSQENYKVNFQMFGKVKTIGQYSHPIYKWLKEQSNKEPTWNFNKYLIDKRGNVVRFASAYVLPFDMEDDIRSLLNDEYLKGGVNTYERGHDERGHEEL